MSYPIVRRDRSVGPCVQCAYSREVHEMVYCTFYMDTIYGSNVSAKAAREDPTKCSPVGLYFKPKKEAE